MCGFLSVQQAIIKRHELPIHTYTLQPRRSRAVVVVVGTVKANTNKPAGNPPDYSTLESPPFHLHTMHRGRIGRALVSRPGTVAGDHRFESMVESN